MFFFFTRRWYLLVLHFLDLISIFVNSMMLFCWLVALNYKIFTIIVRLLLYLLFDIFYLYFILNMNFLYSFIISLS